MNTASDQAPALASDRAEQSSTNQTSSSLNAARIFEEEARERSTKPQDGVERCADGSGRYVNDLVQTDVVRDNRSTGLQAMELRTDGSVDMIFDADQRQDNLTYRNELKNANGKQTFEQFSGREDGLLVQCRTDAAGSTTVNREFESQVRDDGLSNELIRTNGDTTDVLRNYGDRLDGLQHTSEVVDGNGETVRTSVYEGGITETRNVTSETEKPDGTAASPEAPVSTQEGDCGVVVRPVVERLRMDDFARVAREVIQRIDTTGRGSVTRAQLARAIEDPSFTGQQAQALAALYRGMTSMDGGYSLFNERRISLADIDRFEARRNDNRERGGRSAADTTLDANLNFALRRVHTAQGQEMSRELFADRNNPIASIRPDAVTQGTIGDCYFLAALSAVAQTNPELIRNAIRDNGDGTYTVTFPGARDNPVTVTAPTETEQGLFAGGSPHGIWASVMEKAAGELYNQGMLPWLFGRSRIPTEGADGGGSPGRAMALLTGQTYESFDTMFSSEETFARELTRAFSDSPPRAVTAGTNPSLFSSSTATGFYRRHAYSIMGFEPDAAGGGMVTIRNPWNQGENTPGGVMRVPLSVFVRNFGNIHVERRR